MSDSRKRSSREKQRSREKRKHAGSSTADFNSKQTVKKKKSEFIGKARFSTKMPAIPFEPKLLHVPWPSDRLTRFCGASLERVAARDIVTDSLMGIPIDLIDQKALRVPSHAVPVPAGDQPLLSSGVTETSRIAKLTPDVTWLRNAAIISNADLYHKSQHQAGGSEFQLMSPTSENRKPNDKQSLLRSVEKSFADAKNIPRHPTNPKLQPVEVMPIFPDDALNENKISFVTFDSVPTVRDFDKEDTHSDEMVGDGILVKHDEKMYGLYRASQKAPSDMDESYTNNVTEVDHFEWNREYTTRPVPKTKPNDSIVFVFSGPTVRYWNYDERISLRKRNVNDGAMEAEVVTRPEHITVLTVEAENV